MQTITHYYEHLKNVKPFREKYTNYDPNDGKVHILYVSPRLRSQEYYSAILPALELNSTMTHTAIMTSIEIYNEDQNFYDEIKEIDVRLLEWADYIVFPTILSDMKYTINALRVVYPHLQIVMHLDANYYKIPNWHTNYSEIPSKVQQGLLSTINLLDVCICQNKRLEKQYQSALNFFYKNSSCLITRIPTLVSRTSFENLSPLKINSNKVIKIGVFSPSEKFLDYLPSLIKKLHRKERELLFVIFDYKGVIRNYGNNLAIEFHKDVAYSKYFENLNSLSLTMALFSVSEYSQYQSIHTYLEMAVLGVVSIVCKKHPASAIILKEESGLIVQDENDWELCINKLLDQKEYRKQLIGHSAKMAWRNHSYTKKTLKKITSIFI